MRGAVAKKLRKKALKFTDGNTKGIYKTLKKEYKNGKGKS